MIAVNRENLDATTFALLERFPLDTLTRAATIVAAFLFVVTSVVSAAFVLAIFATGELDPSAGVRTVWGVILGALGLAMILIGDIALVRSVIALSAIGFVFITPILVVCLFRALRRESSR